MHIRRIWDLVTRVFCRANPILLGIFLSGRYLESYFEKEVKTDRTKIYQADLGSFHIAGTRKQQNLYYWAHTYYLDFLKCLENWFPNKPRHLRRMWDLGTRVLYIANPILLGIFLSGRYLESYFEKEVKTDHTKIYQADPDSSRRELSVHGLGFVVALLVHSEIDFSCACNWQTIQL